MTAHASPFSRAEEAASPWTSVLAYVLSAALICLVTLGLTAVAVWHERASVRERTSALTKSAARLIESEINGDFERIDVTLQSVVLNYRHLLAQHHLNPKEMNEYLESRRKLNPEVRFLRIVDNQGNLTFGYDDAVQAPINLADREFFIRARDQTTSALIVTGPMLSKISQKWVMVLARRITLSDGSLAGVVYATIATSSFGQILATPELGPHMAATLRTEDLSLVDRYPKITEAVGSKAVSNEMLDAMRARPLDGEFIGISRLDNTERSLAYRKLRDYPLYVIVGEATGDHLGDWAGNVTGLLGLAFIAILITCASTGMVYGFNRRLVAAQQVSQDLYHHAPCAYYSLDADGKFLQINDTALAWFSCSRDAVIGKKGPADFFTADSRHQFEKNFPHFKKSGVLKDAAFDLQDSLGRVRHVSVSANAILDQDGRFVQSRSVMYDVTSTKQAEDARVQAAQMEAENRKLREANRLKDQFLATMSHELRTPLNAVIGMSGMLRSGSVGPDSPHYLEFLNAIEVSGQHLLQLIQDMLDAALIESGKLELRPELIELAGLLGQVAKLHQPDIDRKHLMLALDVDTSLGDDIWQDRLRVQQVVSNLLSNAIKFSPDRGAITVRVRPEGAEQFRIEVEDGGIGISDADTAQLFRKFHQLDAGLNRKYDGAGLGLAIVRLLAEAQGGSVGVRSQLGRGSTFHVVLPRRLPPGLSA